MDRSRSVRPWSGIPSEQPPTDSSYASFGQIDGVAQLVEKEPLLNASAHSVIGTSYTVTRLCNSAQLMYLAVHLPAIPSPPPFPPLFVLVCRLAFRTLVRRRVVPCFSLIGDFN